MFSPNLKPIFQGKDELSIKAGCLLWGNMVVIPEKYQPQFLKDLHASHPGIVRIKGIAILIYVGTINIDIEATVRKYLSHQSIRNQPPLVMLHSWPWPIRPWKRIHIDYAGPFFGTMFPVVVDVYSKLLKSYLCIIP